MNPFRGVSGRRCKRKSKLTKVEIKQEPVIKQECDKEGVIDVPRPRVAGRYRAMYEGPVDFACDFDGIKDEIKCEEEKTGNGKESTSCDRPNENVANGDDNEMSGVVDVQPPQPVGSGRKRNGNAKKQNKRTIPRNKEKKMQKKHKCEVCDHMTLSKSNLLTHLRIHTGEKPFQCDVCSNTFSRKYNLIRHKKTHGQFRCTKCNQGFERESVTINHERCCNPRQFECEICGHKAKQKINLTYHMRIHTGAKPFECSICFKAFTKKSHLQSHSITHLAELPNACSKCDRRFATPEEEQTHETRCQRIRLACKVCHYKTIRKDHLILHMQSKHGAERSIKYGICSKEFVQRINLNQHLSTGHSDQFPFECSKCFGGYATEGIKNGHEESCRHRQYRCHLCKEHCRKIDRLKIHMRTNHTGERIPCKLCKVSFVRKGNADQHMKTVHRLKK